MSRPIHKEIKYFLLYYFVKTLLVLSVLIPRKRWIKGCGFLGGLAYHLFSKARKLTIQHLTLAFGNEKTKEEIYQLAKKTFIKIGQNAGDIFRSLKKVKNLEDLNHFLTYHGTENFKRPMAQGRGVIILTSHIGAFDLQVTAMALNGLKPLIIGTALKDERLNALLQKSRNAYGAVAVERGKESVRIYKALKNGGSIAILIDQDTNVQSAFVNFFNRPAYTPIGAAMLALRSGAAVIPTYIYLDENFHQQMYSFPEIELVRTGNEEEDIIANTQLFTSITEDLIRKHPDQWVWMHQRWKTQPEKDFRL